MERREIITLPLAPLYKTRLSTSGYLTVGDLEAVTAEKLSKDTSLNVEDTARILQIVHQTPSQRLQPRSALTLLRDEEASPVAIVTFCQRLDEALGGGVQCGRMTEICGLPGTGKTQLCLQLACDVQIPSLFGGLEGEAVFIDADGGFVPERISDIAMATVKHCQFIASSQNDKEISSECSRLTVEKFLSGIHVHGCHDNSQLLATVNLLPSFIKEHRKVKLVVLDSVAAHFKQDFDDLSLRTRMLTNLAQTLIKIAAEYNVAVVVTNKMTTKVRLGAGQSSSVIPALGDSWGHACPTRLVLQQHGARNGAERRQAWLYKSPSQPRTTVLFQITRDGIRDALDPSRPRHEEDVTGVDQQPDPTYDQPAKRQRLA